MDTSCPPQCQSVAAPVPPVRPAATGCRRIRPGLACPPQDLGLEVTEGLLLDESELVMKTMRALQEQGIRIMLDDFGTAYANMNYLRRFPFNGLKIDKSFIRGLYNDEITLAIVQAILSLAERLNLSVVAEGVETERELERAPQAELPLHPGLPDRPAGGLPGGKRAAAAIVDGRCRPRHTRHQGICRPGRASSLAVALEQSATRT